MQEILDSVKRFAAGEIEPRAAEVDRTGQLPAGLAARLGEHGLAGLAVPARWGGIEADLATFGACLEIVGSACASTAWTLLAHSMCARAIVATGNDSQKARWLPELASGRILGSAMAGTEAGGGSNLLGIRTAARRDRENWVLDGGKEFISLAGLADLYLVMTRTAEPPASLGCFVLEKTDAGLTFGRREELLGVRGVPVGGFALSGCRLPADRLLGAETDGLMVMGATGAWGLVGAASAALGIAAASLEATIAHLNQREVAGTRLASLAAVQATIGDLQMQMASARAGLAQAIREIPGRKGPPVPLFMAKLAATETAVCVVDRCMALHGAAGYSRELPAERRMRDVRAFTIHWANNEVLRDNIRKSSLA